MTECPECGAGLNVADNVESGELISCSDCGSELEVISTNPVSIAKAPEVEEDWGE
ncbi:MAG: lysine biosynthesis protein LysW [archaeon]